MKDALYAGAAKINITPTDPVGVYLAGFGMNRRSNGVHSLLQARALYLKNRAEEALFITMDLIGYMNNRVERLRRRLKLSDSAALIPCSTHCHSGPDTIGYWGPGVLGLLPVKSGVDQHYMQLLEDRLVEVAQEAMSKAEEIKVAFYEVDTPEGGYNDNIRDKKIIDRRMRLMSFMSLGGERRALLCNYACHPEMLWFDNRLISSDFVGYYNDAVESELDCVSLYFSDALGGMVTGDLHWDAPTEERLPYIEWLGRNLARLAIESAPEAKEHKAGLELKRLHTRVKLAAENWKLRLVQKIGVIENRYHNNELETEMNLTALGPARILTVPGEALPELGRRLRGIIGGKPSFVFGLGCDELGYIPPAHYFDDRNYKYECSMSMGRRTADTLAECAERLAARLA